MPSSSLVEALRSDGITVEFRKSDGFVNATKMAQAGGKQWSHYFENAGTQQFLNSLLENRPPG
jgi:KilA-N domain